LSQGIGDPKRTCIVGWSFGGYAALMGAIKDPELYRCVASIAGVTDLRALTWQLKGYYGGAGTSDYTLGTEADELRAGSPIKSAKQLKAPVLMVHGKADTQVEYDQSVRMNRALDERQKHELVLIEGGDHSLSRFEWRMTLLTNLEAFLAENLRQMVVPVANCKFATRYHRFVLTCCGSTHLQIRSTSLPSRLP
jgi:dipeptidyl aminopeptidase/acylaminoacyl peptidase